MVAFLDYPDAIVDMRDSLPKHATKVYNTRTTEILNGIVLHCDDWATDIETVANYDIGPNHISSTGCPGYTYHFHVTDGGLVQQGQDVKYITWHAGPYNPKTIGVCISYRATGNRTPPSSWQLEGVTNLCSWLCLEYGIDPDNLLGHRELPTTGYVVVNGIKKLRKTCPGLLVDMGAVRYTVARNVQSVLADAGLYTGALDGVFGPHSEAALKTFKARNHT